MGGLKGVYSDFLLHRIADPEDAGYRIEVDAPPLPHEHPLPDEWKTPPLWGVADSGPYWHDGGSGTLRAAIERHAGDAKSVAEAFRSRGYGDQEALIRFLESLRAPRDAKPAPAPSKDRLAGPSSGNGRTAAHRAEVSDNRLGRTGA
jgi:hypothetical protein